MGLRFIKVAVVYLFVGALLVMIGPAMLLTGKESAVSIDAISASIVIIGLAAFSAIMLVNVKPRH